MDGGDVDDASAAALGDELLRSDLRAEEGALEIDVEHALVLLLGCVENRGAGFDAGVVHHDVEAAEVFHGGVYEALEVGNLADIGLHGDGLVTKREDLFLEVFGGFRMHDIVDDDVGSLLGEFEDDRETDAAVSAGDDGCFSFEVHLVVFWVG